MNILRTTGFEIYKNTKGLIGTIRLRMAREEVFQTQADAEKRCQILNLAAGPTIWYVVVKQG